MKLLLLVSSLTLALSQIMYPSQYYGGRGVYPQGYNGYYGYNGGYGYGTGYDAYGLGGYRYLKEDAHDKSDICSRAWCDDFDKKKDLPNCCDDSKRWRSSKDTSDGKELYEKDRNLRTIPPVFNPPSGSLSNSAGSAPLSLPEGVFVSDSRYFKTNVLGVIVEVFPANNFQPTQNVSQNVSTTPPSDSDLVYIDGSYLKRTGPATFEVLTQAQSANEKLPAV